MATPERVPATADDLVGILDLERIEENIFRGTSPRTPLQRIFGGQVAAQALVAAGRTVPSDRPVHSLHAYFLIGGDPSVPVLYEVDRIRDGRSFTTRRTVAIQHGRAIFHLSASFQAVEPGIEHSDPMPVVPPPEQCPTIAELSAAHPGAFGDRPALSSPIEVRYVGRPPSMIGAPEWRTGAEGPYGVWLRVVGRLPDDPQVQVCAVTFASDITLLDSTLAGHDDLSMWDRSVSGASLDHAMWFHQPFRADEWLLYTQRSPSASGGRGLATGQIFTRDGHLAASVVQEGLVRLSRPLGGA